MTRRQPMSWMAIKAEVADAYDGTMRLAADAQRFGFQLRSLGVEVRPDGSAGICMVIGTERPADRGQILERLSRHPTVSGVEARDTGHSARE